MTKTSGSRRISSAMASRSASRMVMETSSVPSGTSGSGMISADGGFGGAGRAGPRRGRWHRLRFLRRGCGYGSLLMARRLLGVALLGGRLVAVLERGCVFAFGEDHGDRGIHGHIGGAFRHENFAERSLVYRF